MPGKRLFLGFGKTITENIDPVLGSTVLSENFRFHPTYRRAVFKEALHPCPF
jgi:hypothetical protein